MNRFSGRLGLQQRVLPVYRVPFFDLLALACDGGMSLFAGAPRPSEMIPAGTPQVARHVQAHNVHLFGGSWYACYQRGFIRWLEEWNPEALIAEANPRYLSTNSAVKWMHARGRKVIGWGLGVPALTPDLSPSGRGIGLRARARLRFLRHFDALIAYSRRGAEEYAALGYPRERLYVAYNSVSPAPEQNPDRGPQAMDDVGILFVGRLQARKRVDHLIRACAEVGSKPRLVIVGDGPQRASLEMLAREVYPAAEFIGAKHGAELNPYFAQADLFVLPGTGGLAVQEAMSHGLPVIVAKGDGTQDDLVRERNGWQILPEDYPALLGAMKNALSDIPRLGRMGRDSFRIVSEEINIQKMVEVFIEALNSPWFGR